MFEAILDKAQAKGGLLTKQNRQKIKNLYLLKVFYFLIYLKFVQTLSLHE